MNLLTTGQQAILTLRRLYGGMMDDAIGPYVGLSQALTRNV
jgi:hypothetical protein